MSQHPIHPPTTHFPIACWSIAMAVDVYNLAFAKEAQQLFLGQFSVLLLGIGCVMAFLSVATGFFAFSRLPEDRAARTAFIHMSIMSAAFILFVVSLFLRLSIKHDFVVPPIGVVLLEIVGFIVLVAGGWVGANIVSYSHGKGEHSWGKKTPSKSPEHSKKR